MNSCPLSDQLRRIDDDFAVCDPTRKHRISVETYPMKVDYNPYEGREVTGAPEHVFLRGRRIAGGGSFDGKVGGGTFLRCQPRANGLATPFM